MFGPVRIINGAALPVAMAVLLGMNVSELMHGCLPSVMSMKTCSKMVNND